MHLAAPFAPQLPGFLAGQYSFFGNLDGAEGLQGLEGGLEVSLCQAALRMALVSSGLYDPCRMEWMRLLKRTVSRPSTLSWRWKLLRTWTWRPQMISPWPP